MKIHAIHIINHPWVFDTIYNVFKPLLNKSMTERIYFHGDKMESLHKHIDPEFLPKKYGGTKPEYPYTLWLESLSRNNKIVEEITSVGYKVDPKDLPFNVEEHKKKIGK